MLSCRREAERDAAAEPLLSSFLYASILAHDTFERALAFVLSNRLANAVMLPTQLFEIFHEVLISEPDVREAALADVEACRERVGGGGGMGVCSFKERCGVFCSWEGCRHLNWSSWHAAKAAAHVLTCRLSSQACMKVFCRHTYLAQPPKLPLRPLLRSVSCRTP